MYMECIFLNSNWAGRPYIQHIDPLSSVEVGLCSIFTRGQLNLYPTRTKTQRETNPSLAASIEERGLLIRNLESPLHLLQKKVLKGG